MEIDDNETDDEMTSLFIGLTPSHIENLRKHGQLQMWEKFNELVAEDRFPMGAYLLFLDVVKW